MTPAEFKEARRKLGRSAKQIAVLMGYGAVQRIHEIEARATVPPQAARLMQAYLDGYRPPDWPTAG